MKILISLFALLLISVSCNSTKETMVSSIKNSESLSGTYTISLLGDDNSISEALSITFEVATNKVSGFAGCNNFFGTYSLDDKKLTLENLASTKKFCQDEVNSVENELLTVLNTVNTLVISDNGISLLEDETVLLKAIKSNSVQVN